jgi:hypothetical protein
MIASTSGYWFNLLADSSSGDNSIQCHDQQSESHRASSPATNEPLLPASRKKQGVKQGSTRCKYEKASETVRKRIIAEFDNNEDWLAVATANGVKKSAAYNWTKTGSV